MSDVNKILKDRGSVYGSFEQVGKVAQILKEVYRSSPNWKTLSDHQKEAFDMIATKQARILVGDPNYGDSWADIAGYSTRVLQIINEKKDSD